MADRVAQRLALLRLDGGLDLGGRQARHRHRSEAVEVRGCGEGRQRQQQQGGDGQEVAHGRTPTCRCAP